MITKYLSELAKVPLIKEVSDATGRYSMFNDGSVETSVGEFLYGLVKMVKPENILETGLYKGWSSAYMAFALKENNFGHIDAVEYEMVHVNSAKGLLQQLGLIEWVTVYEVSSLEFKPEKQYDLLFLDTELNLRFHELVKFYPNLSYGGYVFIHDMPISLCQGNINPDCPDFKNWPVGVIPQQITNWVKDGELRPFFFSTPRGMLGFYKTRSEEHKWV